MRIYFAGAICGGRDDLSVYQRIVSRLKSKGYTVPSEHVASPDVFSQERDFMPGVVYERDIGWLQSSAAVISEISTPSLGVGYEIAWAVQHATPVLCLFREGLRISKMITGIPTGCATVAAYRDVDELDRHVDRFLLRLQETNPTPADRYATANGITTNLPEDRP